MWFIGVYEWQRTLIRWLIFTTDVTVKILPLFQAKLQKLLNGVADTLPYSGCSAQGQGHWREWHPCSRQPMTGRGGHTRAKRSFCFHSSTMQLCPAQPHPFKRAVCFCHCVCCPNRRHELFVSLTGKSGFATPSAGDIIYMLWLNSLPHVI